MSEIEPNLDPVELPEIPLPKGWTELTLQTVLHVIALARIVILNASIWPDGPECDTLRLRIENDRLRSEIALLQREIAIKDARFSRLEPKKRPHYLPCERLEILVIQAVRGLSNVQIAKRFNVTLQTIRNWILGKDKDEMLVQIAEKPTRYPDFVRYLVQQLKVCCPMLGRFKIADILARAGLQRKTFAEKWIGSAPRTASNRSILFRTKGFNSTQSISEHGVPTTTSKTDTVPWVSMVPLQ